MYYYVLTDVCFQCRHPAHHVQVPGREQPHRLPRDSVRAARGGDRQHGRHGIVRGRCGTLHRANERHHAVLRGGHRCQVCTSTTYINTTSLKSPLKICTWKTFFNLGSTFEILLYFL